MRVLKSGQVVLSDKAPKLDCSVRNVSASGACLQFSSTYGLPRNFDLIFDGIRRHCHVAWMTDARMGVAFVQA
jgi:hypothetical protein